MENTKDLKEKSNTNIMKLKTKKGKLKLIRNI